MRVIVIHPAQQHSFQTALSFEKAGMLVSYVTSIYYKTGSLTQYISTILPSSLKERAINRSEQGIPNQKIVLVLEPMFLLGIFLRRLGLSKYLLSIYNSAILRIFDWIAIRHCMRSNVDAIIVYDTWSSNFIESIKKLKPNLKIIIDMSAPSVEYMNSILCEHDQQKEYQVYPHGFFDRKMMDESNEEIRRANHFIVASSVSKQSLVNLGVSNLDIILVPYGTNLFPSYIANYGRPKDSFESPKLRCLFIGSLTYAKGAKHYSDAILSLPKDKYEFHFAGSYDVSSPLYSLLCSSVVFHGHLSRSHLMSVLQSTDILVFPSLVDGFGLSVLEAFSMGVPVICSSGAGVRDIVRNNIDGIIVKSGSSHEICKSLEYLNDNRQLLAKMSENAYFQSKFYTWERYHSELASHFLSVVEGARNDT